MAANIFKGYKYGRCENLSENIAPIERLFNDIHIVFMQVNDFELSL